MKIKIEYLKKLKNSYLVYYSDLNFEVFEALVISEMAGRLHDAMKKHEWIIVAFGSDWYINFIARVENQRKLDLLSLKLRGGSVLKLEDIDQAIYDSIGNEEIENTLQEMVTHKKQHQEYLKSQNEKRNPPSGDVKK
jgi:hypothetical protein